MASWLTWEAIGSATLPLQGIVCLYRYCPLKAVPSGFLDLDVATLWHVHVHAVVHDASVSQNLLAAVIKTVYLHITSG